jgi:hypothetical protein
MAYVGSDTTILITHHIPCYVHTSEDGDLISMSFAMPPNGHMVLHCTSELMERTGLGFSWYLAKTDLLL